MSFKPENGQQRLSSSQREQDESHVTPVVHLRNQRVEIRRGPEYRIDHRVVFHVESRVVHGRFEYRVYPYYFYAEIDEVI